MRNSRVLVCVAAGLIAATLLVRAQEPNQTQSPPAQQGQRGRGAGGDSGGAGATGQAGQIRVGTPGPQPGIGVYPQKPLADAETIARGKGIYSVNCQFCHGAEMRGGDSGPSLLRSDIVLMDDHGEQIGPVLQAGRPPAMPKFDFTAAQVGDIVAYIHSFVVSSRDPIRKRPPTIVTGNATAGQTYFESTCASCHSATGDLKGLAARFADPKDLQQAWLMPGGGGRGGGGRGGNAGAGRGGSRIQPTTATVTLPTGQKYEGRLVRLDEFTVSVADADGSTRTFARDGDRPKVEVHDPLEPHRALIRTYTDKDIHDLTAYLVTLK